MDRQTAFNPDKYQDSQGGLKDSQIIQPVSSRPIIIELDIQQIQSFQHIPDYTAPTISSLPIVVISPKLCSCIDGWDLIQKSKSANNSKISCHAFYIPDHNETEIAIQKVAIRTMPQGGTCSYAELSRNACILFKMLMDSTNNQVVFSHGGSRRGANYAENIENNVRKLLANRLGKSVTTINKYLNHSEFLNAETIDTLVNAGAEKEFFEVVQPYKRKITTDLRSVQNSETDISAAVSEAMLSLLREYQANGKTSINYDRTGKNQSPADENQILKDKGSEPVSKPKEFMHWSGNLLAAEESPPSEDDVCQEIKTVGSLLIQTAANKNLALHHRVEIVSSQIVRLAKLIQQLKHLDNLQKNEEEDQG